MIVVDCSAMVNFLAGRTPDVGMGSLMTAHSVHAPHLLDAEVLNTLRGLRLANKISSVTAEQARADYFALDMERHSLAGLADRIWELRHRMTAYDASYAALAEALDCPLVTGDKKMVDGGHRAEVVVRL